MKNIVRKEIPMGSKTLVLETGKLRDKQLPLLLHQWGIPL